MVKIAEFAFHSEPEKVSVEGCAVEASALDCMAIGCSKLLDSWGKIITAVICAEFDSVE